MCTLTYICPHAQTHAHVWNLYVHIFELQHFRGLRKLVEATAPGNHPEHMEILWRSNTLVSRYTRVVDASELDKAELKRARVSIYDYVRRTSYLGILAPS